VPGIIRTALAISLVLAACPLSFSQKHSAPSPVVAQQPPGVPPIITSPDSGKPEDETKARMEKEMAKKANQERQAALKRDTDKLLALATELKQYVDKSNENMLSLDVIRKADEIEKLAHSVKEKMRAN
jgi:hypothetical protein